MGRKVWTDCTVSIEAVEESRVGHHARGQDGNDKHWTELEKDDYTTVNWRRGRKKRLKWVEETGR